MIMTNCPNCGAPITGLACEYCGTVFYMSRECSCVDPQVPEWRAPITPIEAYKQGEVVRYCGELRRSLINHNVFTPTHDSVWQTVESI